MKILNLALENFRGIKSLEIDFQGKDTDIFGANGLGKTTIANAICWLLIDRPATEEPDFTPKTTGAKALHHKASAKFLLDDGREITLSKDYYEKYTRKKGAAAPELTGNVTDCYIDGVKTKQKDYIAAVEQMCGAGLAKLKMLMVLGYFADEMKTDEKRKILFEMAEEFSDEDVFAKKPELQELKDFLKMPGATDKLYTIDQWKQVSAEQRRGLNKELEHLPTRIDEAAKAIPTDGLFAASELEQAIAELESAKAKAEEELRVLRTPDGQQEKIRSCLAALNVQLETKRAEYMKRNTEMVNEIEKAINRLSDEKRDHVFKLDENQRSRQRLVEQCGSMEEQRNRLVDEYAAVQKEQWDAGKEICPTCGQTLPADKVQELKAQFNQRKAQQKEDINRRGQSCSSAKINAAKSRIDDFDKEAENIKKDVAEVEKRIATLRAAPTEIEPFETTQEYADLASQIAGLKADLGISTELAGKSKAVAEKEAELQNIKARISDANLKLSGVRMVEKTKRRIEELEAERKNASAQLEHLERGIHLCEEFTRTKADMVTESVNKHFRFVKFILFRDQLNGGTKEICEPTVENRDKKWVEYRSANYASKINAKLDIIDTLNKHYKTNLPVIVDQAESVTKPLDIDEQLIRLIVSAPDTETFRIRNRDK